MIPCRQVNVYRFGYLIGTGWYTLDWLNTYLRCRRR